MSKDVVMRPNRAGEEEMVRGAMITISVIVSTYNRSAKLARLLESLAKAIASGPDEGVEVVVVDNRSTDDTRATVERFAELVTWPVRYVFEARPGKSFGLNAGLAVAQGELLALTDDDVLVSENWIRAIRDEFQAGRDVHVLGGRVELYDSSDLPTAVRTSESRSQHSLELFAPNNIPALGANLVLRKAVLEKVGPFDIRLGPGTGLVAEDCDYIYRVLSAGYTLVYSPEVLVFHGHGRKSMTDLTDVMGPYSLGLGAFYAKYILRGDWQAMRYAWWEVRNLLTRILVSGRGSTSGRRRALTDLASILKGAWLYTRKR